MSGRPLTLRLPDTLPLPITSGEAVAYDNTQALHLKTGNDVIIEAFVTGANSHESATLGLSANNQTNAELQVEAYNKLGIVSSIDSVKDLDDPRLTYHIGTHSLTSEHYGSDIRLIVTQHETTTEPYAISSLRLTRGELPDRVKLSVDARDAAKAAERQATLDAEQAKRAAQEAEIAALITAAMAHNPQPKLRLFQRRL